MLQTTMLNLRVHSIAHGADAILVFDLRDRDSAPLPPFSAGSHIDVHMPGEMVRSYSLLNDSRERNRYLIAIKREEAGRGGSAWMHERVRVGMPLAISLPRNHFEACEDAPFSLLFAGGIGITPIWSIAQRLNALAMPWRMHYRARHRRGALLVDELAAEPIAPHVSLSFSEDARSPRLDLAAAVASAPAGTHFYCCGPVAMVDGFRAACAQVEPARVHYEYFASAEAPAVEGGFKVRLAQSGQVVEVQPGCTVLESLARAGVAVPSSCQQGVCGACEVTVLAGTPDHRDLVLSDAEKASGRTMMICCSGALSAELTLDL